jgi:hypothetical protein
VSGGAKFDVRAPLGALFVLLGAIIAVAGVMTRNATPTGIPIALVWGSVMMVFGAVVSVIAFRARR